MATTNNLSTRFYETVQRYDEWVLQSGDNLRFCFEPPDKVRLVRKMGFDDLSATSRSNADDWRAR